MKKFLEMLWARSEMIGKQLYDQQKIRVSLINTYELQTTHYNKDDHRISSKKYHHDLLNNSQK